MKKNVKNSAESYFDLTDETTKQLCDYILQTKHKIEELKEFNSNNYIPSYAVDELLLKTIDFKTETGKLIRLIDLCGEDFDENQRIFEEENQKWKAFTPEKSKYYFNWNSGFDDIPAQYLKKLGFGNVALIRKLVLTGKLEGRVEEVETSQGKKYKTFVAANPDNAGVLRKLRETNPDVVSFAQLAKELGIGQQKLSKFVAQGELEIIPEYILPFDYEDKYLFRNSEKNEEFINKVLFELELANNLKQAQIEEKQNKKNRFKSTQSLRMKLAWYFCPKTIEIASFLAKQDGYLCKLLIKDSNKDEQLSEKEKIKVNSYRKKMWELAGADELSKGVKRADKLINLYFQSGLNAIEDEAIREIFEECGMN